MHSRLLLVPLLVFSSLRFGVAQRAAKDAVSNPPRLDTILPEAHSQTNKLLTDMAVSEPGMPLGPPAVLRGYEVGMNLVVQKMSTEFENILQAQHAKEISREQAEFLLQERYQAAMMQFQVLAALHEALAQDIALAEEQNDRPRIGTNPDSQVVVQLPIPEPSPRCK